MKASKTALWATQRQEFPDSVRIEPYEALMWCEAAETQINKIKRYRQIASTVQYPNGIFYYIAATHYRGYRFGVRPEEYISFAD
jgi:intein-encoded DNA endonuclease-like protein